MRDRKRSSNVSDISTGSMVSIHGACAVDPSTSRGRKWQALQLSGFPLIPAAVLIVFSAIQLAVYANALGVAAEMEERLKQQREVLELVTALRREGDAVAIYTATNGSLSLWELKDLFKDTERLTENVVWPEDGIGPHRDADHLLDNLRQHRISINAIEEDGPDRHMAFYYGQTEPFTVWFIEACRLTGLRNVWHSLETSSSLMKALREVSLQATMGGIYYASGWLNRKDLVLFMKAGYTLDEHIRRAVAADETADDVYSTWVEENTEFLSGLSDMRKFILQDDRVAPDVIQTRTWYMSADLYGRKILDILRNTLDGAISTIETEKSTSISIISWDVIAVLIMVIIVMPLICKTAVGVTRNLHAYAVIMDKKSNEMRKEKRKTERLLNTMLPKAVQYRLKKGEDVGAESFDAATVYFSDISDFTEISSVCQPMQIVVFLNDLYNFMDARIELYDAYKVETIGAVYMVVSGLPSRNGSRHASEIAKLGLDLLEATKSFKPPHKQDGVLQLRIGAHSGPVVAGVVGNKMPRYCLFGDAVNTASRMQSNGITRRFHISDGMRSCLEKIGGFDIETRGTIKVKGKGEMRTSWLNGLTNQATATRRGSISTMNAPHRASLPSDSRSGSLSVA